MTRRPPGRHKMEVFVVIFTQFWYHLRDVVWSAQFTDKWG